MTRDQLEFLISQLVDGTLPATERAALDRRLAEDAQARQILAEYRSIAGMVSTAMPLPPIEWDALSSRISQAVSAQAGGLLAGSEPSGADPSPLADEQLEFAATRYLDGDMSDDEAAAFEARIASEPAVACAVDEYRSLGAVLGHAWELPASIDFAALAQQIGDAVQEQQADAPAVTYKISAYRRVTYAMAVAASLALALGIAAMVYLKSIDGHGGGGGAGGGGELAQVIDITDVSDPVPARPSAALAIAVVDIGPSPYAARRPADALVPLASEVRVASDYRIRQDSPSLPY